MTANIRRPRFHLALFATAALAFSAGAAAGQTAAPGAKAPEPGIAVESELVRQKCGTCHKVDEGRRMSRISYRRASPENWELTIKRMVGLNGVALEPAEARTILKYLADNHGLAPDEIRPARFEAERRSDDFTYEADRTTGQICVACHSLGRVMSERRTKDEWDLLIAMHRGYYPGVDNQPMANGQGFRRTRPAETEPGPDGRPADNRDPADKAVAHLAQAFPLMTPQWQTWSAAMPPARMAGRWLVSAYEPGSGPVFGEFIVTSDPAGADSFDTETRLTSVRTGATTVRTGKAVVYTGFQWRGRSRAGGATNAWREVMMVERGGREMTGRWFTGDHDETGIDVTLTRAGSDPVVTGTSAMSLKTGTTGSVAIFGANFPSSVDAAAVDFGSGIRVTKAVAASAGRIDAEVAVDADAKPGPRPVSVLGATKPATLIVYTKIDGIKVLPQAGLARVGGIVFPKQLQQFEAVAYANGPDGKPGTKDEWVLGPVDAKWSLEEYTATFGDDDLKFSGTLDAKGMFTPAPDGPNPERTGERNNVGDLWVVAEYTPSEPNAKPLKSRAYLLVSVPVYMRWYGPRSEKGPGGTR